MMKNKFPPKSTTDLEIEMERRINVIERNVQEKINCLSEGNLPCQNCIILAKETTEALEKLKSDIILLKQELRDAILGLKQEIYPIMYDLKNSVKSLTNVQTTHKSALENMKREMNISISPFLRNTVSKALLGENCPICLEPMDDHEEIIVFICFHGCHSACFMNYMSNIEDEVPSCPVCRKKLE